MLTEIKMDFKEPMKFNSIIDIKQLVLLTGQNGSGKTFIFKMAWITSLLSNTIHSLSKMTNVSYDDVYLNYKHMLQTYFHNTFNDPQKITGTCALYGVDEQSGDKYNVSLSIALGKIVDMSYENLEYVQVIQFLPKSVRQFNDILQYITIKKSISNENDIFNIYKLDELASLEQFTHILQGDGITLSESTQKKLHDMQIHNSHDYKDEEEIFVKKIFLKDDKIYMKYTDGIEYDCSSLSSGIQSVLMSILFASKGTL